MLSDRQLREEAKKKIEQMTPEERKKIEDEINAEHDLRDHVEQVGFDGLNSIQKNRFMSMGQKELRRSSPGRVDRDLMESRIAEEFHVSRRDIPTMDNPYLPGLKRIAMVSGIAVAGIVAAALIMKFTAADLSVLILILALAALLGGVICLFKYMDVRRFTKLQQSYEDPKVQAQAIDAEVYRILDKQIEAERKKKSRD